MKQDQFLIKLREYIADNFDSQQDYANHIDMDTTYLSLILHKKRPPTQRIVEDLDMTQIKYIVRLYFRNTNDG